MKLCISTLACPAWNLERIVQTAEGSGIAGVDFRGVGSEIDITRVADFSENLSTTLQMLRSHGLSMPCLNTSVTLVTPEPDRWDSMLEEFQRYAALAKASSTGFLRVFGGKIPTKLSREEGRSLAQRHFKQLAKISHSLGCMPLLETHDDWVTSREILSLLHELDPNHAGVLWDVEHTVRGGEKPLDTARALRKFLRHVHFKDGLMVEGKRQPRLLGDGDLPLAECYSALKAVDYSGWICLETEKRWHSSGPEPEFSIPQFAGFMKGLEICNK